MRTSQTAVIILMLMALMMLLTAAPAELHGDEAHYHVTLATEPETVVAEESFTLYVNIFGSDGETSVAEFDEVHTKLLHLIVVSEDLTHFLHLHPDYVGDGVFELTDTVLPVEGNYVAFADFTPTGGEQQAVRAELSTADAETTAPELAVTETEVVAGPLKIHLQTPDILEAGAPVSLTFHIEDAETGEAIDDLDEYLGAGGHLVILDQPAETYLHTHPAEGEHGAHDMAGMEMTTTYGPELTFDTQFPAIGLYALWIQVQYKGDIYTAPYVVEVADLAAAPETTPEAHDH